MVQAQDILNRLPEFENRRTLIVKDQDVADIMKEVLKAHREFSDQYTGIARLFDRPTIDDTCDELFRFLKTNVQYREETQDDQTTISPSGLIELGYGDCKHYAGFAGGILDAIERTTGKNINWCYRFASYHPTKKTPHHVFVVVKDGDDEIFIDPTPGADICVPSWIQDKKPKKMLTRISGFNTIGKSSLSLSINKTRNPLNFGAGEFYPGIFGPYLGLSEYRDFGGDRNLNLSQITAAINAEIANGPNPGHTFEESFVQWVYDWSIRSWNFYWEHGVKPGFDPSNVLPANYPRWVVQDMANGNLRLNLSNDMKLDDYRNPEIHLMTAWAQDLINTYDSSPYPVKPAAVKEFSQGKEGGPDTRNMFNEARGDSIFKEIGKGLEKAVNFIKDGIITIVGFIPRNAFLGLVGINAFNFARHLADSIDAGKWDSIKKHWENLGGKADKLLNTINDGKNKHAILGVDEYYYLPEDRNVIGVEPVSTSVAGMLAAAAPIIAALLAFIDKDGKITPVLSAVKGFLQTKYPDLDLTAFGFLDRNNNQYLQFQGAPQYNENLPGVQNPNPSQTNYNSGIMDKLKSNPMLAAAGAGALVYFVTDDKKVSGMKTEKLLLPLAVAAGVYFLLRKGSATPILPTTNARSYVITWVNQQLATVDSPGDQAILQQWLGIFNSMTDSEIQIIYQWISQYLSKSMQPDPSTPLYAQLVVLDNKYHFMGE